ncbi:MAG TPA: hypothetical protein VHI10_17220 [Mycobacterium sp.]|nr:hypothetical protein [Mycobacterium sp.]
MNSNRTASISAQLRRLVPAAALVVAAVGVPAGTTIGCPAIAGAAPVWDIDSYDQCTSNIDMNEDADVILEALKICCEGSGGVWDERTSKCTSPYPEGQGVLPPKVDRPTAPVQPPDVGAPTTTVPVVPVQPPMVR